MAAGTWNTLRLLGGVIVPRGCTRLFSTSHSNIRNVAIIAHVDHGTCSIGRCIKAWQARPLLWTVFYDRAAQLAQIIRKVD